MLQCQAAVKVPGSFRPVAGSEHLYSHCNFAESLVETVSKSLRHSCRSELHLGPRVSTGDRLCLHLAQLIVEHLLDVRDLNRVSRLEVHRTSHFAVRYTSQIEWFRTRCDSGSGEAPGPGCFVLTAMQSLPKKQLEP